MRKIVLLLAGLSLAACTSLYEQPHVPYVPNLDTGFYPDEIILIEPQFSSVPTGGSYAHFELQPTGWRVTYREDGIVRTTFVNELFNLDKIFY